MSTYTVELPLSTKTVVGVKSVIFLNGIDVAFYDAEDQLIAFYRTAQSVVKEEEPADAP